jgi:hypothetical protein
MEKMARALEIPLYQLLYDGEKPRAPANRPALGIFMSVWFLRIRAGVPVVY